MYTMSGVLLTRNFTNKRKQYVCVYVCLLAMIGKSCRYCFCSIFSQLNINIFPRKLYARFRNLIFIIHEIPKSFDKKKTFFKVKSATSSPWFISAQFEFRRSYTWTFLENFLKMLNGIHFSWINRNAILTERNV